LFFLRLTLAGHFIARPGSLGFTRSFFQGVYPSSYPWRPGDPGPGIGCLATTELPDQGRQDFFEAIQCNAYCSKVELSIFYASVFTRE
jgi:hypothetical protein